MSLIAAVRAEPQAEVLTSLRSVCDSQGLQDMSARLADLSELVRWDMKDIEGAMAELPAARDVVQKSAVHLLARGGKRLRPMCVALAARAGSGFDSRARDLAIAVELVHCATLLHDDVVDVGDKRRGAPAARTIYGNAASIFAGDWLLIEALRRVRRARVPGTLDELLTIIDEMIAAEAIQLEARGRVDMPRASYFRVVEGKTAALFRWAMLAGARSGGLDDDQCHALEQFGVHLGVAFQLVDDLLDYAGDAAVTGKALFTDLREGKMTYPLIVALERDPGLRPVLETIVGLPIDAAPTAAQQARLLESLRKTGALDACRDLARERTQLATRALERLPEGRSRAALLTVAHATVTREA